MYLFSLYMMALLYIGAGITHFLQPKMYKRIMPAWVPAHGFIVLVSGIIEIVLGLLLLFDATRSAAAWSIMIFLVLVFPANVQMAVNFKKANSPWLWIAWLRLPLQLLLIWWAWQFA